MDQTEKLAKITGIKYDKAEYTAERQAKLKEFSEIMYKYFNIKQYAGICSRCGNTRVLTNFKLVVDGMPPSINLKLDFTCTCKANTNDVRMNMAYMKSSVTIEELFDFSMIRF